MQWLTFSNACNDLNLFRDSPTHSFYKFFHRQPPLTISITRLRAFLVTTNYVNNNYTQIPQSFRYDTFTPTISLMVGLKDPSFTSTTIHPIYIGKLLNLLGSSSHHLTCPSKSKPRGDTSKDIPSGETPELLQ